MKLFDRPIALIGLMLSSVCRFFSEKKNPFAKKLPIPGIGRVILAASCKGGVGKSTVALNTAIALSDLGNRVAILDADMYGPSIPTMTATLENKIMQTQEENFLPIPAYGIETLSIGNTLQRDQALLWKGPMMGKILDSFLKKTMWSPADYLIIDTPPGTGDVQMALWQSCKIDGAILVTTPQEVALADVRRNIEMFKNMNIPILGVVQNMDGYVCPCCKKVTRVFPGNGGKQLAKQHNLELLGSLAVDPTIPKAADEGFPAVLKNPNSSYAQTFRTIAMRVMTKCPKVELEDDFLEIDMKELEEEARKWKEEQEKKKKESA